MTGTVERHGNAMDDCSLFAIINLRVPEEMKRKLTGFAKATGTSQTDMVRTALAERLAVHEIARTEPDTHIPSWVPEGKYVALVRGAVAAVGDSVADVVTATLAKFPDDAIHVARKGKSIKPLHYAFLAQTEMKCWKYVTVDQYIEGDDLLRPFDACLESRFDRP